MRYIFTPLLVLIIPAYLYSQNTNVFENRIILKHHTGHDLQQMQANDTLKFLYVKYFYIHSFTLQPISCNTCPPYMPDLVDVSEYDYLRQENHRVSYTDSAKGYRITLFSKRELEELIKYGAITSNNNELKSSNTIFGFPRYFDTGNSNDFQNYIKNVKDWINSNPFEFFQLKNNPNITILDLNEYHKYSKERKDYILQNTDKFILTDNNQTK